MNRRIGVSAAVLMAVAALCLATHDLLAHEHDHDGDCRHAKGGQCLICAGHVAPAQEVAPVIVPDSGFAPPAFCAISAAPVCPARGGPVRGPPSR